MTPGFKPFTELEYLDILILKISNSYINETNSKICKRAGNFQNNDKE